MHLNTIEDIKDYLPNKINAIENISNNEILEKIEENLTGEIRQIYLKMKSGIKIGKNDTDKLVNKIREILDA